MPSLEFSCDITQAFNFKKDQQSKIGHIHYLKVGDTELKQDFNITDPLDFGSQVKVTGVASNFYWDGGFADAMQFSCNVSIGNKVTVLQLLHKEMSNIEVKFQFAIYSYDLDKKTYYKALHSGDEKLTGVLLKRGDDLSFSIDDNADEEVPQPLNYQLSIEISPDDSATMDIHTAVGKDAKFVKQWGVKREA